MHLESDVLNLLIFVSIIECVMVSLAEVVYTLKRGLQMLFCLLGTNPDL
jgi:hypothetical protein